MHCKCKIVFDNLRDNTGCEFSKVEFQSNQVEANINNFQSI